ncbi:MAG: DUF997 family protein [Verrucomicrobiota bacterium]
MKEREPLADSFRQSRKEFLCMIGIWAFFAVWTMTCNSILAPLREGEEVPLLFGMPEWVVWGVALPWVLALSVTIWFALRFMKDTELEEEKS